MPSISLQELQDLREIANAATAGPWETGQTTFGDPADGPTHVCVRAQGQPWQEHLAACDGSTQSGRDFAHIAAFDPPTALALIDEIEKLQRWKREAKQVLKGLGDLAEVADAPLGHSIIESAIDCIAELHKKVENSYNEGYEDGLVERNES